MGLTEAGKSKRGHEKFAIPPDLRAQLGSQGITGVKFIAIDFFDVKSNPPPELPFAVPEDHYIPAAPSMMKNLEDTITKAMDRLPEMVDAVVMIMGRVDRLLAVLEKEDVSGKAAATLGHADEVMLDAAEHARAHRQAGPRRQGREHHHRPRQVAVNKMNDGPRPSRRRQGASRERDSARPMRSARWGATAAVRSAISKRRCAT